MTGRAAQMELSIEVGSDPISGSLSVGTGAQQQFCGWIELVAAIESVRFSAPGRVDEALGALTVAEGRAI